VSEDRELRDLLEQTQAELKQATERLEVLEEQSTDALEDKVDELEGDNAALRVQLEQGDAHRESAAQRQASLERELAIARTEQQRLQSQLETMGLERNLRQKQSTWHDSVIGYSIVGLLALIGVLVAFIAGLAD